MRIKELATQLETSQLPHPRTSEFESIPRPGVQSLWVGAGLLP
jgi:hypothetical protein